ncbi:MAG: hypothetical protein ACI9HK_004784 [Pirellulaceae bacterium]|jgi:hypothetical protein
MNPNLTDITLVIDRSGSMSQIQEGGVNAFIAEQAAMPGEATLTLVHFDTEYEFLLKGVPIKDAPAFTLHPRGMTALLDAVGRAMNETGERWATLAKQERPGLVVFVVMTDGVEMASKEFSRAQIRQMVAHQRDRYNWQFSFRGADQDAFAEAESMEMRRDATANYAKEKVFCAMSHTADKVGRRRRQSGRADTVDNPYTTEELDDMN